jgi:hypothetical protein
MTRSRVVGRAALVVAVVLASAGAGEAPPREPALDAARKEAEAARRKADDLFLRIRAAPGPEDVVDEFDTRVARVQLLVDRAETTAAEELDGVDEGAPRVHVVVSLDSFDLSVFGTIGEGSLRKMLDAQLDRLLQASVRSDGLPPRARAQLELAGRGDIVRFLAVVDRKRREFDAVRGDVAQARRFLVQNAELHTIASKMMFGRDSLFMKTLSRLRREEGDLRRQAG